MAVKKKKRKRKKKKKKDCWELLNPEMARGLTKTSLCLGAIL